MMMTMERWSPWRAVRQLPNVFIAFHPLPEGSGGAAAAIWPDGEVDIVLDPRLGRRLRKAALAHEVIHVERERGDTPRGDPSATSWRAVQRREEQWVTDEAVRRLVPLQALASFCASVSSLETEAGDVWMVGEAFDVPDWVAARALRLLEEEWAN